ncbi:DMT family transporter [Pararhodobacter sp.]|uniref:DMT family transporter n=1 Tax=Pararhodobacter sp. TaxID=2127056 RepID=UPI002FDCE1AE
MNNLRGSLMMVAAMAGFAIEDALIKYLALTLPVGQIMVLIGLGGALIFGLIAHRQGYSLFVPEFARGAVLLRNLSEMLGAATFVTALVLAPLAAVTAILQAMPLAVTLGAALFLGEPVGWRRWSAILIGFLGVLLIVRPGSEAFDPASLLAVIAVFALSARDLATRRVATKVHSLQLSGWGFGMVAPAGLLLMLLTRTAPVAPSPVEWGWLVATLSAGILAYAALVSATRLGDIAVTTPFRYSRLIFAMIIGLAFFGEIPDAMTLAGSALVVGAGLYTLWRQILLQRQRR